MVNYITGYKGITIICLVSNVAVLPPGALYFAVNVVEPGVNPVAKNILLEPIRALADKVKLELTKTRDCVSAAAIVFTPEAAQDIDAPVPAVLFCIFALTITRAKPLDPIFIVTVGPTVDKSVKVAEVVVWDVATEFVCVVAVIGGAKILIVYTQILLRYFFPDHRNIIGSGG